MSETVVRPAKLSDLPPITGIYNHYIVHTPITFDLEPVTAESRIGWFREHSEGARNRLFVAERAGAIVGYAGTGRFRDRRAYDTTVETTIYCAPGSTGLGIGVELYEALFAALAGEDINRIVAGITLPNDASVALHRRFGFTPVGTFTANGRKFGRYWDVLWMERPLALPARGRRSRAKKV
jgi:phosphinothricin acetyltransferase